MQEIWVRFLGREESLEKEITHSNIFAWRIPWTKEATVHGISRVGHDLVPKPPPLLTNSLRFCLSGKVLISLYVSDNFARQSTFGWRFLSFRLLRMAFHFLLACRDSVEESADSLMASLSLWLTFKILYHWCLTILICVLEKIFLHWGN